MAAGAGGAHGGSFESTVDRKFASVSNTMDSIQGLSTWCIDNKKYHSLIVRHWIKCLKKSDAAHKLNLFYLANDVIQNCKRKNAIVYRTAFADVLPEAFLQISRDGDAKVVQSVERILTIWEDRTVYSGALITALRTSLVKEESPPETPVEQKTPVESKADIRSKIVAEFVPQALIDQMSKYKKSLEELDLRGKQLAAMRVDICNTETLKRLKDKAGGKRFSKDFEEGNAKLQEFVKFFDKQNKTGPPLLEALSNADIFYEMQYKEVKIVANAYQTFANRVSLLKRKLDSLKATLPDLDESPIPSPSADAPSPTGSESPFHGLELANPDPDLDGLAMDEEAEPPAPSPLSSPGGSPRPTASLGENDNREVEDMDLSDEEAGSGGIIVEEQLKSPKPSEVSIPVPAKPEPSVAAVPPVTHVTPPVAAPAASVKGVDLGKIESILNSLSSVIKISAPSVESSSEPALTRPSVETKPAASVPAERASSLVNLLSKVEMSPADILSALSKVQGKGSREGVTSHTGSPGANVSSDSSSTGKILPSSSSTSASTAPSQSLSLSSVAPVPSASSSTLRKSTNSKVPPQANPASALVQALHRDMDLTTETASKKPESLESKIHNFLHGNPAFGNFDFGFSTNPAPGGENLSPPTGTDTQGGTPVRDEGGGTPTQDEIMDKPVELPRAHPSSVGGTVKSAPVAFQYNTQQNPENPQPPAHSQPGGGQNGQLYQPNLYGKQDMSERGITTPVAHYQPMSSQSAGPVPGERAPGGASSTQGARERGWYGDTYPEGGFQQPTGYSVPMPGGAGKNMTSGLYPYQTEQTQEFQASASQQGSTSDFFRNMLPPVPQLPPPPKAFENPASVTNSAMMLPEQQPAPGGDTGEMGRNTGNSVISGMVVHDHGHKSMFHPDDQPYDRERHHHHPEGVHPHPDNLRFQEDLKRYHGDIRQHDALFFQDNPYQHPDDPYYRPGSPPHHYPRVRGRLTPPLSPSEDPYYPHDYQRHSPPPHPHFTPRRPPPHLEIRHPGLRPPHLPPHPAHHPYPRGPLRAPFPRFQGPDPRLRGKRPGPRGRGNPGPMFPPKRPFLPPRY